MQTQTEGLIIKSRDINENDTVVKILTGDLGLISAFATGTKKVKSRTASAAVSPMTTSPDANPAGTSCQTSLFSACAMRDFSAVIAHPTAREYP